MKQYPSILRSTGQSFEEFDAYIFSKYDGSNLRFEWSKKRKWYKFGTRHRLFDETDPIFGYAISAFQRDWADSLEEVFTNEKWERGIAFLEYWGPTTLGGLHTVDDDYSKKKLTLFDVAPYKQGLLGPKQFLELFGHLEIAEFLGCTKWTRGYVNKVYNGEIYCSFEGVVGKAGHGKTHDLKLAKAKTKVWIEEILARYGEVEGTNLIES